MDHAVSSYMFIFSKIFQFLKDEFLFSEGHMFSFLVIIITASNLKEFLATNEFLVHAHSLFSRYIASILA